MAPLDEGVVMVTRDNPGFAPFPQTLSAWRDGAYRLLLLVDSWLERRRQRRSLLGLSDHMLKDIGVTRGEALREGAKPFWRP